MSHAGLRMSTNEKEFIVAAIREEQRIDGRTPFDYRRLQIKFLKFVPAVLLDLFGINQSVVACICRMIVLRG